MWQVPSVHEDCAQNAHSIVLRELPGNFEKEQQKLEFNMRLLKKETYSLPPNGEEDRSFLFCRAYWTKRIDQTFFGAHLPSGNLKCAGHFVLFDPLKRTSLSSSFGEVELARRPRL
jgi:hypothetical protein